MSAMYSFFRLDSFLERHTNPQQKIPFGSYNVASGERMLSTSFGEQTVNT